MSDMKLTLWGHAGVCCMQHTIEHPLRLKGTFAGADGQYLILDAEIFAAAATEASLPKRKKHWSYPRPGHDPEFYQRLFQSQVREVISAAEEAMDYMF